MFQATMSNSSLSEEASLSSFNPLLLQNTNTISTPSQQQPQQQQLTQLKKVIKKKRSPPGNPDPDAEVVALSPKSLLATNRFLCEICNKGFQRDQNLQLHRRGHNLPWKLKSKSKDVIRKKVYVCPEPTCVHHHPARALGDLTGVKKHFSRKHGEKKFKCEKCSKVYAVQSDWKAHSKTCGTREYRCDCGTLFSRRDSFITHRAFCDALAEESARLTTNPYSNSILPPPSSQPHIPTQTNTSRNQSPIYPFSSHYDLTLQNPNSNHSVIQVKTENHYFPPPSFYSQPQMTTPSPFMSATALLQKAATVGAVTAALQSDYSQAQAMMAGLDEQGKSSFRHIICGPNTPISVDAVVASAAQSSSSTTTTEDHHQDQQYNNMGLAAMWQKRDDRLTRDFLGLTAGDGGRDDDEVGDMLNFTNGLQYRMTTAYDRDNSSSLLLKPQSLLNHNQVEGFGFGSAEHPAAAVSETSWG